MFRLKEDYMHEIIIKKSRFLCYLHTCHNEEDAKAFILRVKKEHPNANHHCYAFLIGEHNELARSNDDGEPSGTAGVPMLECLHHRQMQDIVAVSVRYFGGIKLGAGGLIRAYTKSVAEALESAILTKKQTMLRYQVHFSYDLIGKLDYYFRQQDIRILEKDYGEDVQYTYLCVHSIDDALLELSNGLCVPVFLNKEIIDIDLD